MKKAFVTGWPVSHSKSPDLHGFWLREHKVEGSYEAFPVEPEKFPAFLESIKDSGFCGGNVTIPHKEIAFECIEELDQAAKAIGAVNTIWLEGGVLCGGNTDAYGFAANLDEQAPDWRKGKAALVLGAGGASRAVLFALLEADYSKIWIVNRTISRAQELCQHFGEGCSFHGLEEMDDLLGEADLFVNTTSLGMQGSEKAQLPDFSILPKSSVVTDIVYTPLMTPFLQAAEVNGLKTVDGLGMLLHQAVPGFEKWFGPRPKVTSALRKYILGVS